LPIAVGRPAIRSRSRPNSLYTLVDSPIVAGAHEKSFPLGGNQELDVSADSAAALDLDAKFLAGMKHLVAEGPALYGGKHYRDYHFLLTLSDPIGFEGIEHHESSDDRAPERYAIDDKIYRAAADLLPHEYSHSWNGKYRRPADLAVPDYQQPELTDLLWVYEGLNQYNGEKLATRARISSFHENWTGSRSPRPPWMPRAGATGGRCATRPMGHRFSTWRPTRITSSAAAPATSIPRAT
jgi:predicted metalloprotease with PDZ domain